MLKSGKNPPAAGARAIIRDEEWLIQNTEAISSGGYKLTCMGISETVRHRSAQFLTTLENVEILDPANTVLVQDQSAAFTASRLYLEAQFRQAIPTSRSLIQGHKGVMDAMAFQLEPTTQILGQVRPRLLIADTVGLGKTLEAGIVTAELMRRGKARRILVVTTKSMMKQFQQEFWSRFSIALTRLDSAGIQRIRREIPSSHNPFNYYDRTIISVDTLKRDSEYRHHLEKAYWDLIIIDEAHNVSYKGNRTQSNRLADLLSQRSDALILLTATPHNGKKESFASLMRMLDPTVLPERADYTRTDIDHLFVRRFKKDVREQMRQDFPERKVYKLSNKASVAENQAFEYLSSLKLHADSEQGRSGAILFKTTLEKSLFSSPQACLQTLQERISKLHKKDAKHEDLDSLQQLHDLVSAIEPLHFSKYQHLIRLLKTDTDWRWNGSDPSDRLVIFTERIETLNFLREHLPTALGLKPAAVAILHGQLPDIDTQSIVEDFGKTHSPLRLLIASDVASEGLNLHYQSHRLMHFDIPWSLMVFQQRNGRVDRYGQSHIPHIGYLMTEPDDDKIRGDLRILEILIDKDEQAAKNIGDPSSFMGLYDEEEEVTLVANAMQQDQSAQDFAAKLMDDDIDPLDVLFGDDSFGEQSEASESVSVTVASPVPAAQPITATLPSLYANDYMYTRDALNWLKSVDEQRLHTLRTEDDAKTVAFQPPADLERLLKRELSTEMQPTDNVYALSADPKVVERAITAARDTDAWPKIHYLWPLHPIAQWLDYKVLAAFRRQQAPVMRVGRGLEADEAVVILLAQHPNKRGQPMLTEWLGVKVNAQGQVGEVSRFSEVMQRTGLQHDLVANDGRVLNVAHVQAALPEVIKAAQSYIRPIKAESDAAARQRVSLELDKLKQLQGKHMQQLQLDFDPAHATQRQKQKNREIVDLFAQYKNWVHETLELDDRAQMTVVTVLTA